MSCHRSLVPAILQKLQGDAVGGEEEKRICERGEKRNREVGGAFVVRVEG